MYTLIQCPLNETLIYLILVTQFEAIVSARSNYRGLYNSVEGGSIHTCRHCYKRIKGVIKLN